MKFGIFLISGSSTQILGRADGSELWFEGLVETIDFIKSNNIEVYDFTVIREIAPINDGIIVNEFDSVAINKMLNGEYPEIIYW